MGTGSIKKVATQYVTNQENVKDNPENLLVAYQNIARAYNATNDKDAALTYFKSCSEEAKAPEYIFHKGYCVGYVGQIFLEQKNYDEAKINIQTAADIFSKIEKKNPSPEGKANSEYYKQLLGELDSASNTTQLHKE